MAQTTCVASLAQPPARGFARLAVWNRWLLIAAATMILCAASMLALYAAGPEARALAAGEGTLITGSM